MSVLPRTAVVTALFLVALFSLPAQPRAAAVGEMSAAVGSVEIIRDGAPLPAAVRPGTDLYAEDLLRTGTEGGELLLFGRGRLSLAAESVVHLAAVARGDGSTPAAVPAVEVRLLAGVVRFIPFVGGGAAADSSAPTTIDASALTVSARRGEVTVFAAPGDRRLVSTEEGRQSVRAESGERRFAEPGRPVVFDTGIRNIREEAERWLREGVDEFSAEPPGYHGQRMREYIALRERFDTAYEELLGYRVTVREWLGRADRRLDTGAGGALESDGELRAVMATFFSVGREMEERFFQLRMDAPYLSEEHREYLADEEAYLLDRLHQRRRLRAILGPLHG